MFSLGEILRAVRYASFVFFIGVFLSACGGGGSASSGGGAPVSDSDLTLPSQLEVVTYEGGDA